MSTTLRLLALSGLLAVSGCSGTGTGPAPLPATQAPLPPANSQMSPAPVSGNCQAANAQFLLGRIANAQAKDDAKAATGVEAVRVLYPGQPVTQEFQGDRLTVDTDNENRITAIRCG